MDVFLVPVGANRHDLYCEAAASESEPEAAGPRTLWTRAVETFRRVLAEGEEERRQPRSDAAAPPRRSRLRRAITTRLAEAVAEQRLLWHLRHETTAGLVHPDDMTAARALELTRASLTADLTRHGRWSVIDTALAIVSIPVALVPGPNVIGYYFVFRAVGHVFSWRGARHGLRDVVWQCRPTPHLTALRAVLAANGADRAQQVEAIAAALGLERLAKFVDRTAPRN
jgi:hypothetical protein